MKKTKSLKACYHKSCLANKNLCMFCFILLFSEKKMHKCDVLRDLVPFAQFKKHEQHPWKTVFHVFYIVKMVSNRVTHHK